MHNFTVNVEMELIKFRISLCDTLSVRLINFIIEARFKIDYF